MGPNSPMAPAPSTKRPKSLSRSPASRRMGISVPIAVVLSATATSTGSDTNPAACRANVAANASATETSQPSPPSRKGGPRNVEKSRSMPARKNRIERPRADNVRRLPSPATRSSTCGPTRMPSSSSSTTNGSRRRSGSSLKSGAIAATKRTISSACVWTGAIALRRRAQRPGACTRPWRVQYGSNISGAGFDAGAWTVGTAVGTAVGGGAAGSAVAVGTGLGGSAAASSAGAVSGGALGAVAASAAGADAGAAAGAPASDRRQMSCALSTQPLIPLVAEVTYA